MTILTDEIELKKTCSQSPEQYDAFYKGKQVGYLRLRHGEFRVDYPKCGEETIFYTEEMQGDGIFEDDERDEFLLRAKQAIVERLAKAEENSHE